MNKMAKVFLNILVAGACLLGSTGSAVKAAEVDETSVISATETVSEATDSNKTITAGVSDTISKIDFTEPVAPEPVVEEPVTYSINGYDGLSQTRFCIVNTAMGMQGLFSYNLGSKPDYNNNWKIGDSLDCSGFVEYVFWLVTGQDIGEGTWMQSTENVEGGRATYISHEELKPGDLAFLMDGRDTVYYNENGEKCVRTNHVGIYCGKDAEGNDLWCHCNAKDNTVSVNSVSYWTKYMRLTSIDMESNDSVLDAE